MSDEDRRALRGCDAIDESVDFEWLEEPIYRCPWAVLTESPEIFEVIAWWEDFETFGSLPYGNASIADEPFFVYEALRECARVKNAVFLDHHEKVEREMEELRRRNAPRGR